MRYHEIVNEIRKWPLDQQLLLLEEMTRLLRDTGSTGVVCATNSVAPLARHAGERFVDPD